MLDNECIICLESILYPDFITSSHGNTNHPYGYHLACWLNYRKTSDKCPYCREKIPIMETNYKFDYNKPIQFIAIEMLSIMVNGIEQFSEIIKTILICCLTCKFMNAYIHLRDPISLSICLYCCYRMSNDLIDNICYFYDILLNEFINEY
jgi:hypothetical protein